MLEWISIETLPTRQEVLVWSAGKYHVACLLEGIGKDGPWRVFMDARSDEVIATPSHWMPLPEPPAD